MGLAAAIAAIAVLLGVGVSGTAGAESAAPARTRVAEAQIREMRAVVTATRTPDLTATVRLHVQTRRPGGWHDAGTLVVGKRQGWFWYVLRGRGAVCAFTVSGMPARTLDLRLLVTPSIGCEASTHHFRVEQGRLVER
jgi:hypothetical protein